MFKFFQALLYKKIEIHMHIKYAFALAYALVAYVEFVNVSRTIIPFILKIK